MNQIVVNGDNIGVLKTYPDNYFDAVVTDPPYGLGKEPVASEVMESWVSKGYHEIVGKGFMGKEWDAFVPQPVFWKEVFRVLKHGGHVVAFYGTRTYDWGVMAMRFAGFEIRDCIQWLYGCLSDDTEILTRSGYVQYRKFINLPNFEQQEILIYDSENDIYKWEKPERWNEYNIHKDTCYRIKSDSTDQIVSRNHRCLVEREGKLVFQKAEYLAKMEYMPTLSDNFFVLQESKLLQSKMQRILSGSGLEEMGENRFGNIKFKSALKGKQRREESFMERRNNLSKKEGLLFGSQVEVCEMSTGFYSNGEEGWLRSGVSFDNGDSDRQTFVENGVRTPHRPQPNEQSHKQLDAICIKQGTQAIRVGRSYSTTLATITPIEYSGVIFCPTVSTGAFVARRNGKLFLTGNSGFPKSHNISIAIDKLHGVEREVVGKGFAGLTSGSTLTFSGTKEFDLTAPATDDAKKWHGWGSNIKPANEPIVLARKPLEEGLNIAENVLKWGTGGININATRIPTPDKLNQKLRPSSKPTTFNSSKMIGTTSDDWLLGRFPANIILTHHPDCVCKGLKKIKSAKNIEEKGTGGIWNKSSGLPVGNQYGDENGEEAIEVWECHKDCPIRLIDVQSGDTDERLYDKAGTIKFIDEYMGGASRFFYVAKPSKWEKNNGLQDFEVNEESDNNLAGGNKNFHPTIKPVKLMQYLAKMITPVGGRVLDPFCGSGTTGIACKLEGFEFVGIEQDPEYTKLAESRINNYSEDYEQPLPMLQSSDSLKPQQLALF